MCEQRPCVGRSTCATVRVRQTNLKYNIQRAVAFCIRPNELCASRSDAHPIRSYFSFSNVRRVHGAYTAIGALYRRDVSYFRSSFIDAFPWDKSFPVNGPRDVLAFFFSHKNDRIFRYFRVVTRNRTRTGCS